MPPAGTVPPTPTPARRRPSVRPAGPPGAAAIGFQMKLFNIGIEGQYRLAACVAAIVGGAVALPPVLHTVVILLVGALVGAAWAGIAALLKAYRGVSEVISTIMLNFVATG